LLASTFEVLNLNSSNPITGWFKVPATGTYRFYVACDAACSLDMNTTAYNSSDILTEIPEMETIASREEGSEWR